MSKGAEGERFLAAFSELKAAVADDPAQLDADWKDNAWLQNLCDEITQLVRKFEVIEEQSRSAFTNNVSAAGAHARRDYDNRWREVISRIANREIHALLAEILGDFTDDYVSLSGEQPVDPLALEIAEWKDAASEEAGQIDDIIDYVFQERSFDDCNDRQWIDASLRAWDRLEVCGLDIAGALWRRSALPHVLIPSHVAKHYGASHASLYRRLDQAGKAFVFGAPLAALALQRAIIEEVLAKHWGAEKGKVRDANLPELQWDARADRLKRLANEALHGDPERLIGDALDRAIIENFGLLRLLIENAPQDLVTHQQQAK